MTPPTPPTPPTPATTPVTMAAEPMTDAELAEIAARAEAASLVAVRPASFESNRQAVNHRDVPVTRVFDENWAGYIVADFHGRNSTADADFFIHARADCLRIARELAAARASLSACRAALEYYGDPKSYMNDDWQIAAVINEYGKAGQLARDTLAALADAGRAGAEGG